MTKYEIKHTTQFKKDYKLAKRRGLNIDLLKEIISKLGMKNLSKGVKVNVEDGSVIVDLSLNIKYGYGVPEVSANVQDKVKTSIENMTGLTVSEVNVQIAGVAVEGTK